MPLPRRVPSGPLFRRNRGKNRSITAKTYTAPCGKNVLDSETCNDFFGASGSLILGRPRRRDAALPRLIFDPCTTFEAGDVRNFDARETWPCHVSTAQILHYAVPAQPLPGMNKT